MNMDKTDLRDFEERYQTCFVDFGLKTTAGFILGSMFSSFFMRGNLAKWPKYVCGGLGLGMAYNNCETSLNDYLMNLDPKLCRIKKNP